MTKELLLIGALFMPFVFGQDPPPTMTWETTSQPEAEAIDGTIAITPTTWEFASRDGAWKFSRPRYDLIKPHVEIVSADSKRAVIKVSNDKTAALTIRFARLEDYGPLHRAYGWSGIAPGTAQMFIVPVDLTKLPGIVLSFSGRNVREQIDAQFRESAAGIPDELNRFIARETSRRDRVYLTYKP